MLSYQQCTLLTRQVLTDRDDDDQEDRNPGSNGDLVCPVLYDDRTSDDVVWCHDKVLQGRVSAFRFQTSKLPQGDWRAT